MTPGEPNTNQIYNRDTFMTTIHDTGWSKSDLDKYIKDAPAGLLHTLKGMDLNTPVQGYPSLLEALRSSRRVDTLDPSAIVRLAMSQSRNDQLAALPDTPLAQADSALIQAMGELLYRYPGLEGQLSREQLNSSLILPTGERMLFGDLVTDSMHVYAPEQGTIQKLTPDFSQPLPETLPSAE